MSRGEVSGAKRIKGYTQVMVAVKNRERLSV